MSEMDQDDAAPPIFTPQLSREEAVELASQHRSDRPEITEKASSAGEAIRNGDYSFENLRAIFKWKVNDRGKNRLDKNSREEVEEALRLAAAAKQPRSAIAVLKGLSGVNVPVASAIMTSIYPDKYTVIDRRALKALGVSSGRNSVTFYLCYLRYCTALAKEWNLCLRDLDHALWDWPKKRQT
jgi:hypothetical protein